MKTIFLIQFLTILYSSGHAEDPEILPPQKVDDLAAKRMKIKQLEIEGWNYLIGEYSDDNIQKAISIFEELQKNGSPLAQRALFLLYGTGIGVPKDQKLAYAYALFSSMGKDPVASLAMAIRYFYGMGVTKSCQNALSNLRDHAKDALSIQKILTSIPQKIVLNDENSESMSLLSDESDIILYFHHMAVQGDVKSAINLGQMYGFGYKTLPENFDKSVYYLEMAIRYGSHEAEALLGLMYLKQGQFGNPFDKALKHLNSAVKKKVPMSYYGLGLVYLYGFGESINYTKAFEMFEKGIENGVVEASSHLGYLYFQGLGVKKNYPQALKYFLLLSGKGSIRSMYYLGLMAEHGMAMVPSCDTAFEMYRSIVEKVYLKDLIRESFVYYLKRDYNSSLVKYMFLAEVGIDAGFLNAAHVLLNGKSPLFLEEHQKQAFLLWTKASMQGNGLAHLSVGDSLYYGYGTEVQYEKAFTHYRLAMELQRNPRAIYNVAYMYQNGIGTERDIHMAKRYYDMAIDTSSSAYLPATAGLLCLKWLMFVQSLKGNVNIIFSTNYINLASKVLSGENDLAVIAVLSIFLLVLTLAYFILLLGNESHESRVENSQPLRQ